LSISGVGVPILNRRPKIGNYGQGFLGYHTCCWNASKKSQLKLAPSPPLWGEDGARRN
jgi:hypothetical protein